MENGREKDKKIKSKNRIREKSGLSAIEATRLANVDIDGGDRRVKHDPTADCVSRILYAMMMSNLIYLYILIIKKCFNLMNAFCKYVFNSLAILNGVYC